ncbi:MAG: virulence RhuM family protein [Arcobacteraceae bacterium]|nr:virulence RhuM family protein [Arcobacteraceae bacterium]
MQSNILIYTNKNGDIKVDVKLEDKNIWLSQKQMANIFGKSIKTVSEHISNIFKEEELEENSVIRNFRTTANDGKNYNVNFYNLDLIIAVGFRVKSLQGTQFRIWATKKLNEYITKGFVLNDERFKNGNSMVYFGELQDRLREIRISERFFYQKIKDIYTTSIDYDPKDEQTIEFFKIIQNKLLWAISSQTASELVHSRVSSKLPLLGMQSFDKNNTKSITKRDVNIAKNYLNEDEIKLLGLLTEQYLAFAETMAQQQTSMYMKDWIQRLDSIISLNGRELLDNAGKISREAADEKSYFEYNKYKKEQLFNQNKENLKELEEDMKSLIENAKY